jgi:hypothetical protein
LKEAFAKTGKDISELEIKLMLERHVIKENGNLGFEEFKMIFFEDENNQLVKGKQNKSKISIKPETNKRRLSTSAA